MVIRCPERSTSRHVSPSSMLRLGRNPNGHGAFDRVFMFPPSVQRRRRLACGSPTRQVAEREERGRARCCVRTQGHARVEKRSLSTLGMTIVTALSWLSRRIWGGALLAVIAVWCLCGWHFGVAALFAFYGIAWFALYDQQVKSPTPNKPLAVVSPGAPRLRGAAHGYHYVSRGRARGRGRTR